MSEISQFSQGLHEECGVFGMYDKTGATDMVSAVYSALYALQHRGQESCGIALNVDGVLSGHRDLGLVSEVFTKRVLEDLPRGAKMATGHVRYATAGQRSRSNAQPMILHHCKGAMAVCHNGNLVNAPKLRRKLEMSGSIFHGTSDTEVIAYLLTQNRLLTPNIEMAVSRTMDDIEGAYSLVIMSPYQADRRPRPQRLPPAVHRRAARWFRLGLCQRELRPGRRRRQIRAGRQAR